MDDMKKKVEEICCLKEKIVKATCCEFDQGLSCVDIDEASKVVDMIKDLATAEKDCCEAEYYKTVTKAMHEGSDDWDDERRGYNHRHFMNGRFAPTGEGHTVRGYMPSMKPYVDQMPYVDEYLHNPNFEHDMNRRRGYDGSSSGGSTGRSMGSGNYSGSNMSSGRSGYIDGMMDMYDDRYGRPYHEYKMARKNYTTSHSMQDKNEMDNRANEHIMATVETVREIYRGADPELRKRIKEDITKLVSEMNM